MVFGLLYPLNHAFAERLYSKNEIVSTIEPQDGMGEPLELIYAAEERIYDGKKLFVTMHREVKKYFPKHIVAVYREQKGGYKLLQKFNTSGYFLRPQFFWIDVGKSGSRCHLFHVTEVEYGTGHFNKEHIFSINVSGDLVKVEFTPASSTYQTRLNPNEGIWKGEVNKFSEQGLFFEFYIWNKGDANCCPSGGKVTGEYKIVETEFGSQRYKIFANKFKRETIKPQ